MKINYFPPSELSDIPVSDHFAIPAKPYKIVCGHWKDKFVAIHGPNGHITSGLTPDQAKPIIDELNSLHP